MAKNVVGSNRAHMGGPMPMPQNKSGMGAGMMGKDVKSGQPSKTPVPSKKVGFK